MLSRSDSVLLKIGGLGFLVGFASWITWAVLAVLSFEGILLYNCDFRWMSGVFFQAPYSRLIFYGLLALSSLFNAVGCFALSKEQGSGLGLICGMGFAVTFVITIVYLVPFVRIQSVYPNPYPVYLIYATYLLPLSFFLSLILWGAWLLMNERKIGVISILFFASGALGILMWPAILYWGFEFWLLSVGWLYASGALMTTLLFFKVSRTPHVRTS